MKTSYFRLFYLIIMFYATLSVNAQNTSENNQTDSAIVQKNDTIKYKVTFLELGSVRCVPCKQMQPILKSIQEKYGTQVKVVFHDVWTPLGKPVADQYNIQAIPTQIFLDENGKEFFRHEGFFPEKELIEILKKEGVK